VVSESHQCLGRVYKATLQTMSRKQHSARLLSGAGRTLAVLDGVAPVEERVHLDLVDRGRNLPMDARILNDRHPTEWLTS
jgi:hypothetical protein